MVRKNILAQTAPALGLLGITAPAQTAPAQTAPAQTAPAQTAPAQTAPAQTAPAQTAPAITLAQTKYTKGMAANGATVGGLATGTVASFAAITVNGRAVFGALPANAVWAQGPLAHAPKTGTYAGAVWAALVGKTCAEGIAAALVAAANQPGAVPAKYAASYQLVALWLQGQLMPAWYGGAEPSASHKVNAALHLKGYLLGYMLKPAHGGLVLRPM